MPAKPTPICIHQPDGRTLTIQLHGNRNFNYKTTLDGYLIERGEDDIFRYLTLDENQEFILSSIQVSDINERSASEKDYLQKIDTTLFFEILETKMKDRIFKNQESSVRSLRSSLGNYPTVGSPKALVILVEFQDVKFSLENPAEKFSNLLNQENYSEYSATGSVRDYFYENSSGLFTPEFDVYGPIQVSRPMAYYGENSWYDVDEKAYEMVIEACTLLDDVIDFREYDVDEDGEVDNVYLFYASYSESEGASADHLWAHQWKIEYADQLLYLDGVQINTYACSSELRGISGANISGIGSFTHEFCHVLGLPDLYTTVPANSFTPQRWSVLDTGSYNNNGDTPPYMTAYERYDLGWLNPIELHEPDDIELDAIYTNQAYIIKTDLPDEYYLLENRQMTGWDRYIPWHGMLIWHIDYNEDRWSTNTVNIFPSHQHVDIVEADNIRTAMSITGDPFPGTRNVTAFTDDTQPSMQTWARVPLNKPITNIQEIDGIISFSFMQAESTETQQYEKENIKWHIEKDILTILAADDYSKNISVYNLSGRLLLKENFSNEITINRQQLPASEMYIIRVDEISFKVLF